jgi:DNA-binding HxlR family transcriptional regulator
MKTITKCPAERAVYFFGGKWKIRILFAIYQNKVLRFGNLRKILSTITQQMLAKQLKELVFDGIINRKVFQVVPPKVEYSLSDFGLQLIPILKSLNEWNNKNSKVITTKLTKNLMKIDYKSKII